MTLTATERFARRTLALLRTGRAFGDLHIEVRKPEGGYSPIQPLPPDAFREALHAKEETEREAELSRLDYVDARAHRPLHDFATAAMIYAEAANKAALAAELYEGLVVDEASTQGATIG